MRWRAVQLLRNTIHGEAIQRVEVRPPVGGLSSLLEIPDRELARLLPIIDRRGGRERWGVNERAARTYIDPQMYIEAVFAEAPDVLNELMARTRVERLPGVGNAADLSGPPSDTPTGLSVYQRDKFAVENRRRLRTLAGFSESV